MKTIKVYDTIKEVPISEIVPYWNNPRLNEKTRAALVDAFAKIGFNQPILIDAKNVIVKGHSRYYAAKLSGFETVPCIVSDASDAENKEDRVLDNKIQELSSWLPGDFERELGMVSISIAGVFNDLEEEIDQGIKRDTEKMEPKEPLVFIVCPVCGKRHDMPKSEVLKLEETV